MWISKKKYEELQYQIIILKHAKALDRKCNCGKCGNPLYELEKADSNSTEFKRLDPKAEPSNLINGAIYCVCPKCRNLNKHRFGGLI